MLTQHVESCEMAFSFDFKFFRNPTQGKTILFDARERNSSLSKSLHEKSSYAMNKDQNSHRSCIPDAVFFLCQCVNKHPYFSHIEVTPIIKGN